MKTKLFTVILIIFISSTLLQSCAKKPYACFSTSVPIDSINVGENVLFNALCSDNATEYFWEFYNGDTIKFDAVVTVAFKDTGETEVVLLITNGTKSSAYSQTILVKP